MAKRGDWEASDLLVFGYLEELGGPLEPSRGSDRPENWGVDGEFWEFGELLPAHPES